MIKNLLFLFFFSFSFEIVNGQDLFIEDFSMPICANGQSENDTLHWFESFNGETNGCNYKVVLVTLFTTWWGYCVSEAPIIEELYQTYKDQGLEAVGFGADWYEPYSCTQWANLGGGLTYPIVDFETGAANWYDEDAPYLLYQQEMGWGLPYNIIVDHNMEVVWGCACDLGEDDVLADAISAIESALWRLEDLNIDNDEDGINNNCDPCPDSHIYIPGNLDASYNSNTNEPSMNVIDLLLLADVIESGTENVSDCLLEASDVTGDNFVNMIDVFAFATMITDGLLGG